MQLVFIESKVEDYQNILKKSCKALAFASFKARDLELVTLSNSLHGF